MGKASLFLPWVTSLNNRYLLSFLFTIFALSLFQAVSDTQISNSDALKYASTNGHDSSKASLRLLWLLDSDLTNTEPETTGFSYNWGIILSVAQIAEVPLSIIGLYLAIRFRTFIGHYFRDSIEYAFSAPTEYRMRVSYSLIVRDELIHSYNVDLRDNVPLAIDLIDDDNDDEPNVQSGNMPGSSFVGLPVDPSQVVILIEDDRDQNVTV